MLRTNIKIKFKYLDISAVNDCTGIQKKNNKTKEVMRERNKKTCVYGIKEDWDWEIQKRQATATTVTITVEVKVKLANKRQTFMLLLTINKINKKKKKIHK